MWQQIKKKKNEYRIKIEPYIYRIKIEPYIYEYFSLELKTKQATYSCSSQEKNLKMCSLRTSYFHSLTWPTMTTSYIVFICIQNAWRFILTSIDGGSYHPNSRNTKVMRGGGSWRWIWKWILSHMVIFECDNSSARKKPHPHKYPSRNHEMV